MSQLTDSLVEGSSQGALTFWHSSPALCMVRERKPSGKEMQALVAEDVAIPQ